MKDTKHIRLDFHSVAWVMPQGGCGGTGTQRVNNHFYAPAMTMAGALSVTPVRRQLSNSNTFDQNFMKLGHIV